MAPEFQSFFRHATGYDPYPFQERFAEAKTLPHLLRAPTGAGKTATAVLGWLWRLRNVPHTPRRLVYCLPMRVLVEQSEREASRWIGKLREEKLLAEDVPVHVLMGGAEKTEWFLHPEKPAVLIGTQDMLLSRALNRGYAATRFHWPIDFGLLNNDCLWVFDEPQLMANGVSTSAQLAGLRQSLATFGGCPSVWMSATLEPGWLDTFDFRGKFLDPPLELTAEDYNPALPLHKRMTATKALHRLEAPSNKDMKDVAKDILAKHVAGTQTLAVVNVVDRAKALYEELVKLRKKSVLPELLLVHSRFRPHEREKLNEQLQAKGEEAVDRIIVATQVVEAGVDISARTLVTELAPWSSIVQRIGRCNRTGDDGPGQVFWIDLDEKLAMPYSDEDLAFARQQLTKLEGQEVSPKSLDDYKTREGFELRFEHKHVLRRRDLLDLFDTSPDLSGNDIDITRFVRSDDPDIDVKVFWRAAAPETPKNAAERRIQEPQRSELCNVPIGSFKKEFLEADKFAYRFDHLDGDWRKITKKDAGSVVPGQVFWVTGDQGGYDLELGWFPKSGKLSEREIVPPKALLKSSRTRSECFYDSDEWAQQRQWRSIADHTDDVFGELEKALKSPTSLPLTEDEHAALRVAARWHDWGKIHDVFQSGIREEIDDPKERQLHPKLPKDQRKKILRYADWQSRRDVAKAEPEFWGRYRRLLPNTQIKVIAKRFRHELASVLGVLALQHEGKLPADWAALSPTGRWLALYLIAAHHGKVRLAIRAMPEEAPLPDADTAFAGGVWSGDPLADTDLGHGIRSGPARLCLKPMALGGESSWTGNVLALRDRVGPFRLAYLEALLRAADCRASGLLETEGPSDE